MTKEQKILIIIVKCVIRGMNVPDYIKNLSMDEKNRLCNYAIRQGLVPFISYFEEFTKKDCDPKVLQQLQMSIYLDYEQNKEIEKILNIFEEKGIYSIPLKGIVTKNMYPLPELRTMGDLDILYQKEQSGLVKNVMHDLGYISGGDATKHDHYTKEDLHVEMHKELLLAESKGYSYFRKIWDRAKKQSGKKYCYRMTLEDHYIFTLYHLIEHFIRGGIGIRMILDMYVLNHCLELDKQKIEKILKELEINKFNSCICKISELWFGDEDSISPEERKNLQELEEYIVSGGAFGSIQNDNLNRTLIYGSKYYFFITALFPSYKSMQTVYSWLHTPVLLPYAWIKRWFDAWLKRRKNVSTQLKWMLTMETKDQKKIKERRRFFEKYGLF